MSDPEIKIKFTANTDDVEKKVESTAKNLEKMSNAGSGKASEELDKVTEAATDAETATEKLVSSWNEYKQKVKDAEAEVRKLNATQFETAEQRDAAINDLGDKLDDLVYEGKTIEDLVKAIGVAPESLQGFEAVVGILVRANKEFEIALNHKEKLLNQPTAPDSPLITTNPWEDGPGGGGPNEFKKRYEDMRAELESYAAQMGEAIAANDRMKSSLEAELASLDKNAAGYTEQKRLLESLISACDSYAVSSEAQRQSIQKQKDSLDELNKETLKSEKWEEGLQAIDKYGNGVISTSLKVQKSVGAQIAIQNRYENAVLSAQQKELKGQEKLQAQMEMAGKSREELIRLVEEYGKALANAQTKEEYEAAKAGISAARKQLTLLTREASLTGQAMIGSQTSVQGLVTTIGRLGAQGRLTFKALSNGVKLFAKSTLVLAGIQFAWEALSKIYEKVKGDLFGVAEAEEEAAERAEKLAAAAKEAADNLASVQKALRESQADQARADAAKAYADAIAQQNERLKEQLKLIEGNTNAILFQQTLTAKDEEQKIAIEKEKLQREKLLGLIDEYEYERRILELNEKAVKLRAMSKVDAATAKHDAAAQRVKVERQNLEEIESTALEELGATPEELAARIARFEKNETKIQQYESKYNEREALKTDLSQRKATYKKLIEEGQYDTAMTLGWSIKNGEKKLSELNDILNEVDSLIIQNESLFNDLPQQIQDAQSLGEGLAEYTKTYKDRVKYNEGIEKQREEALKRVKEAEAAELEASEALTRENQSYAQITTQTAELNREKNATLKAKKEIAKTDAEHTKKLAAERAKVRTLELAELNQRINDAQFTYDRAEGRGPDAARAKKELDLYRGEVRRRSEELTRKASAYNAGIFNEDGRFRTSQGKSARKFVTEGLSPDSNEEARFTNKLAQMAQDVVTSGRVNSKLIAKVEAAAKAVQTTSGTDDDAALERVVELLIQVVNATEKNARKARKTTRTLNTIKRRIANLDV